MADFNAQQLADALDRALEAGDTEAATELRDVLRARMQREQGRSIADPDISQFEAGARGAARGFSFGTSDEIAGAIPGLDSADDFRYREELARSHHPWTYGAGEIAGAAATGYGLLRGGAQPV